MSSPSERMTGESPCALCGAFDGYRLAERGRRGEPLRVLLCAHCGLGRVDPLPHPAELEKWYGAAYRREYKGVTRPSPARLWRLTGLALERTADAARRIPPKAAILDVGCGAGELVYLLRSLGHDAAGFDPDSHYVEWARQTLGPCISAQTVERFSPPSSNLGLVTMYHVLEHMPAPLHTLRRVAAWLCPEGLLVIEVPNLESTVQGPGHQFHKAHLHYFNQATLTAAAAAAGLALEEGGAFDHGENLRCYFRRRQTAAGAPPDTANVERLLAIVRGHGAARHYFGVHPYRRLWNRFSRTVVEAVQGARYGERRILELRARQLAQRITA